MTTQCNATDRPRDDLHRGRPDAPSGGSPATSIRTVYLRQTTKPPFASELPGCATGPNPLHPLATGLRRVRRMSFCHPDTSSAQWSGVHEIRATSDVVENQRRTGVGARSALVAKARIAGRPGADDREFRGLAHRAPCWRRTLMPARASTMQAWRFDSPSISTRHSWHSPMRHHGPRGEPETGVVRKARTPLASSAAATESPVRASKVVPSKSNVNAPAAGSGSLRNIEAIR